MSCKQSHGYNSIERKISRATLVPQAPSLIIHRQLVTHFLTLKDKSFCDRNLYFIYNIDEIYLNLNDNRTIADSIHNFIEIPTRINCFFKRSKITVHRLPSARKFGCKTEPLASSPTTVPPMGTCELGSDIHTHQLGFEYLFTTAMLSTNYQFGYNSCPFKFMWAGGLVGTTVLLQDVPCALKALLRYHAQCASFLPRPESIQVPAEACEYHLDISNLTIN